MLGASSQKQQKQPSWDFGRFVRTFLFYNPPSQFFASALGFKKPENKSQFQDFTDSAMQKGLTILVTDKVNEGDLDLIQTFTKQKKALKILTTQVKDSKSQLEKNSILVGTGLQVGEFSEKDLPTELQGAQAVVSTSQNIEVSKLLAKAIRAANTTGAIQVKDVINPNSSGFSKEQWGAIDDVVMGGVSNSYAEVQQKAGSEQKVLVFKGNVTDANNGGFASIRNRNFDPPLDLSGYDGIEIRIKGNGLRYKVQLRCDNKWDGVSYSRSVDTKGGEVQTIRIKFPDFKANFRAKFVDDAPPADPKSIVSFQVMLSKFEYNGELNPHFKTGFFELPIEYIRAYTEQAPEKLRLLQISGSTDYQESQKIEDTFKQEQIEYQIVNLKECIDTL